MNDRYEDPVIGGAGGESSVRAVPLPLRAWIRTHAILLFALACSLPSFAQGGVQLFFLVDGETGQPFKTLDAIEGKEEVDINLIAGGAKRINLGVIATGPGGADNLTKVEFYDDETCSGPDPIRVDFEDDPSFWTYFDETDKDMLVPTVYNIGVIAEDVNEIRSPCLGITLTVKAEKPADEGAPNIDLITPRPGATYYDETPLAVVRADDAVSVAKVEFALNGAMEPSVTLYPRHTRPFEWKIVDAGGNPLTDGTYSIRARVTDVAGNFAMTDAVDFEIRTDRAGLESVAVHFDQPIDDWGKSRMGFNHGIEDNLKDGVSPPTEFLEDALDLNEGLDIGTTRDGDEFWKDPPESESHIRLHELGADIYALVNPGTNPLRWPNGTDQNRPYDPGNDGTILDFGRYEAHLTDLFEKALDREMMTDFDFSQVYFEMWNEPALDGAWGDRATNFHGTPGEFFETMDVWHDKLRDLADEAGRDILLAAPGHGSDAAFNPQEIEAMMKHLRDAPGGPRTLDVLTLHHLRGQDEFGAAGDILEYYCDRYLEAPGPDDKFEGVGLREIVLNEFLQPVTPNGGLHYYPAALLFYPYLIENGRLEEEGGPSCLGGGGLTCNGGGDTCFDGNLVDTLFDDGGQLLRRPIWWVFERYSRRLETGLKTSSTFGKIISIASMNVAERKAQILLGMYGKPYADPHAPPPLEPETQAVEIRLLDVISALGVMPGEVPDITIERIPYLVDQALDDGPDPPTSLGASRQGQNVVISNLEIEMHAVYVIDITMPES